MAIRGYTGIWGRIIRVVSTALLSGVIHRWGFRGWTFRFQQLLGGLTPQNLGFRI